MVLDESTASDLHFLLAAVEKVHGSINWTEVARATGIRNPSSARTRLWRIRKKVDAIPLANRLARRVQRPKREKVPRQKFIDDDYLQREDEEIAVKQEPLPLENTSGGGGFVGRKKNHYAAVGNGKDDAIFIKSEPESEESDADDDDDDYMMQLDLNTKFRGVARPRPSLASKVKTEPLDRDVSMGGSGTGILGGGGGGGGGMRINATDDPDIARLMNGSRNGAATGSRMVGFFSTPEKNSRNGVEKAGEGNGGGSSGGDIVVLDE